MCVVGFIIKLQFSHRPWHYVKVKTFCMSCYGRIIWRRPILSRNNFTLPRQCLVLVRVGYAFYDHKFDHFLPTARVYRWTVFFCWFRWTFRRVSHDTFMCVHIGKVFTYGCCYSRSDPSLNLNFRQPNFFLLCYSCLLVYIFFSTPTSISSDNPQMYCNVMQSYVTHSRVYVKDSFTMGIEKDPQESFFCWWTNKGQRNATVVIRWFNRFQSKIKTKKKRIDIISSGLFMILVRSLSFSCFFPAAKNISLHEIRHDFQLHFVSFNILSTYEQQGELFLTGEERNFCVSKKFFSQYFYTTIILLMWTHEREHASLITACFLLTSYCFIDVT